MSSSDSAQPNKHMLKQIIAILFCISLMPGFAHGLPSQSLPSSRDAEIREAVTNYILQKTANLGWETRIKKLSISGNPVLPDGPLELEVMAPQQWEGWGNASLAVVARQGERVVRNITVRVEVEALAEMVVALRQLDHGTVITGADIAIQKRDVASVSGKFTRMAEDIAGKRARMTLKANSAVRLDQVEKVPLIKSGQMVTIVAENEVLKISVAGKARSAGAEGDIIMVQNLNSLKEIAARVVNASTVQVSF
jgi:flagellar basal body P-ring formation protein FlgA